MQVQKRQMKRKMLKQEMELQMPQEQSLATHRPWLWIKTSIYYRASKVLVMMDDSGIALP